MMKCTVEDFGQLKKAHELPRYSSRTTGMDLGGLRCGMDPEDSKDMRTGI